MGDWTKVIYAMQSQEIQNVQRAIDDIKKRKEELDKINFNGVYKSSGEGLFLPTTTIEKDDIDIIVPEETIEENHCVYSAYQKINKILKELNEKERDKGEKEKYIGAISHGCHGIDFLQYYFPDRIIEETNWAEHQEKRVMILLEAPASNLDVTYGYLSNKMLLESSIDESSISAKRKEFDYSKFIEENPSITQNDSSPDDFKKHLSSVRWWLDEKSVATNKPDEKNATTNKDDKRWWAHENHGKDDNITKCLSSQKMYGFFVAAIMRIFGLTNVYATNLMRLELFEVTEKENTEEQEKENTKEKSLKWEEALSLSSDQNNAQNRKKKKSVIDIAYEEIFLEEIKAFKPDIIFATANPCNYLSYKDHLKNDLLKIKESEIKSDIPICKIPHPANQKVTNEHRLCLNICYMAKELAKHGILTDKEAQEAICTYYLKFANKRQNELES